MLIEQTENDSKLGEFQSDRADKLNIFLKTLQDKNKLLQDKNKALRNSVEQEIESAKKRIAVFKILLSSNIIFSAILLIFITIENRKVLAECGEWFLNRVNDLKELGGGIIALFKDTFLLLGRTFHFSETHAIIITLLLSLALVGLVFLGSKKFIIKILDMSNHGKYYRQKGVLHNVHKAVISADIILTLYLTCFIFYEPFKRLLPCLNIFTIWLLLSFSSVLMWNIKDIIKGFRIDY